MKHEKDGYASIKTGKSKYHRYLHILGYIVLQFTSMSTICLNSIVDLSRRCRKN